MAPLVQTSFGLTPLNLTAPSTMTAGAGVPGMIPAGAGQMYYDTTNHVMYVANGTSSSANWIPISPTNWTTFTAEITGAGTSTNVTSVWRRVGDSMDVNALVDVGTVEATLIKITIPNSLSIDSSKFAATDTTGAILCGEWVRSSVNAAHAGVMIINTTTSVNHVYFGADSNYGVVNPLTPQQSSQIFNTADRVSIKFTVPITEWAL